MAQETGKIKFFNKEKGFGFIISDGHGDDVFFHVSQLKDQNIKEKDKVSYDTEEGKKGLQANNVTKI